MIWLAYDIKTSHFQRKRSRSQAAAPGTYSVRSMYRDPLVITSQSIAIHSFALDCDITSLLAFTKQFPY